MKKFLILLTLLVLQMAYATDCRDLFSKKEKEAIFEKVHKWFEREAKQEDPVAQYMLGMIYLHGDGIPKDREKAMEWFEEAATQGYLPAQTQLQLIETQGGSDIFETYKKEDPRPYDQGF